MPLRGQPEEPRAVNTNRPVNLDLTTIKQPLTAITSILHRISGIVLFLSLPFALWMLDKSLSSEAGFNELKSCLSSPLSKVLVLAVLAALVYHLVAGIRHLIMDLGFGETKEGGLLGSRVILVVAVVLFVLVGIWLW